MAALFAALALAGAALVVTEWLDYKAGQQSYGSLQAYVETAPQDGKEETAEQPGETAAAGSAGETPTAPGSPGPAEYTPPAAPAAPTITSVDFAGLQALNSDVAAWIEVPGTNISYPIVFRPGDSDYYLTHTVDGVEAKAGAIHLDGASAGMESENILVYGHNLADNTMFSQLHRYKTKEFYDGHPYIYIYLPDGSVKRFIIAAVAVTEGTDLSLYMSGFSSAESAQAYYDRIMAQRMYDTGITIDATEGKQTILLSTCYRKLWKRLVLAVEA